MEMKTPEKKSEKYYEKFFCNNFGLDGFLLDHRNWIFCSTWFVTRNWTCFAVLGLLLEIGLFCCTWFGARNWTLDA